jgi:ParB family transcriptional regulator, chromosome partitioning protein
VPRIPKTPVPEFPKIVNLVGLVRAPLAVSYTVIPGNSAERAMTSEDHTDADNTSNVEVVFVDVNDIEVGSERRKADEAKVVEIAESMNIIGLINPPTVVREKMDGRLIFKLIAGGHRLKAAIRLGWEKIPCVVLAPHNPLLVDLMEIDENLIRNNPGPAEHAKLTARRAKILQALAEQEADEEAPSQIETASTQSRRWVKTKDGREKASIRDQAEKTGEDKDKIHRSKKRGVLGKLLHKINGTSLDKGVEMDALIKLPEAEREELVERAASGEKVSARTEDRKPAPKVKPAAGATKRQKALALLKRLRVCCSDLDETGRLKQLIAEFEAMLSKGGEEATSP